MTPEQASLERYRIAIEPHRRKITAIVALGLGVIAGLTASGEWGTYLLWRNATPFGVKDPQFGLDLSFYTFTLPFVRFVLGFAFTLILMTIVVVVVVQYIYGGLRLQPKGDRATAAAQAQLSLLLGLTLGFVGIDGLSGQARFTFGVPYLLDGIDPIIVAIGLFAVGETLWVASRGPEADGLLPVRGSVWMTRAEWARSWKPCRLRKL